MTTIRTSRAFTLVELLVVIAIIGILAGLITPIIGAARRSAKRTECANNLKQFGYGLMCYAEKTGYLCSGSFDAIHDGDPRGTGWVADLVNGDYAIPGQMLCPSNQARLSKTWTAAVAAGIRTDAQVKSAVTAGYNTNYVASWYLTRSDMRDDLFPKDKVAVYVDDAKCPNYAFYRDNIHHYTQRINPATGSHYTDFEAYAAFAGDPNSPRDTMGPMASRRLARHCAKGTSDIPLLADGALDTTSPGDPGAATCSGGPVVFPAGWLTTNPSLGQDLTQFGPVHGHGNNAACNVLYGDGRVEQVLDGDFNGVIGFKDDGGNVAEISSMFLGSLRFGSEPSGK